mmetsp:Transcript_8890/g.25613  ORF Transcript_8890/g.25613 Transcript_8890/m.25613 type:complete len:514 (+) Transcript_8890:286-1827(+)
MRGDEKFPSHQLPQKRTHPASEGEGNSHGGSASGGAYPLPAPYRTFLLDNGVDPDVYLAPEPPRYIRTNPRRFDSADPSARTKLEQELGHSLEPVRWLDPPTSPSLSPGAASGSSVWSCLYSLPNSVKIAGSQAYKSGQIYGIDAASAAAVRALECRPGDRVLDICCAPGAKLCMICDEMNLEGLVVGIVGTSMQDYHHTMGVCLSVCVTQGHDCGPVPGTTWPPPPVPPLNRDGLHNMPADPSRYWGLPKEPNAWATGKKGTAEERSFQRGDIGAPPFLTKPLDYSVRANDEVRVGIANCGCYQFGVQPDPETSTIVANIDLLTYPPVSCQELCVEDPECEAFSSTDYKCLLWKNVTEWRLDQGEPIMISGPRLCPTTLIEQGYACSLDHYRAKFSSLSLLMLRIPKISMPYGESCPTQINPYVFVFIMAACLLVFMAYGYARHTRRRHPSTVVWRVVMAAPPQSALSHTLHLWSPCSVAITLAYSSGSHVAISLPWCCSTRLLWSSTMCSG